MVTDQDLCDQDLCVDVFGRKLFCYECGEHIVARFCQGTFHATSSLGNPQPHPRRHPGHSSLCRSCLYIRTVAYEAMHELNGR